MKTTLHAPPEISTLQDRELSVRVNDGIQVVLWYRPNSVPARLYVTVHDFRSGIAYDPIDVPSPDKANHVFHHAMSYIVESATQAALSQAKVVQ